MGDEAVLPESAASTLGAWTACSVAAVAAVPG